MNTIKNIVLVLVVFACMVPVSYCGSHGTGTFAVDVEGGLEDVFIANTNLSAIVGSSVDFSMEQAGASSTNYVYIDSSSINSAATGFVSRASGSDANGSNDLSFVWSGVTQDIPGDMYGSHDAATFNVNPDDGFSGAWIGETNLQNHINSRTVSEINELRNSASLMGDNTSIFLFQTGNNAFSINFSTNTHSIKSLNTFHGDIQVTNGSGISVDSMMSVANTGVLSINGRTSTNFTLILGPGGSGSNKRIELRYGYAVSEYEPLVTYEHMASCIDPYSHLFVSAVSSQTNKLSTSSTHFAPGESSIVLTPHTPKRVIISSTATVKTDDEFIWLDSETANRTQILTLHRDKSIPCQSIVVYHLGSTYPATIEYGTNTYTLSGDGESMVFDWLAYRTNWYPRPN